MKVALGADHAGFEVKELVKKYLQNKGIEVIDLGTNSSESVDYPDFARQVAQYVAESKADWGVLACKSGIGMSIAANKIAGVRAALVHTPEETRLARGHNNANVMTLSGATTKKEDIPKIIDAWLETAFEGGRHQGRIDKISEMEDIKGK